MGTCAWCDEAATVDFHNGFDDAEMALCSACAAEGIPADVLDDRPAEPQPDGGFQSLDEWIAWEMAHGAIVTEFAPEAVR